MRTVVSSTNIVKLSDIRTTKLAALSPFGPVRVGLTTLQTTQDRQLMELLSSLEREVMTRPSKSYTVSATSISVTRTTRVAPFLSVIEGDGTDETCDECGNDLPAEGESKCLDCLESMI